MQVPERFIWATELLHINPSDKILEIGCGAGLLAEQMAARLKAGRLIALDRSASMINKARKRNKKFIESGASEFYESEFLNARLPESYFNYVVAFNVNFFLKDPVKELQIIKNILKRDAKLYVFYQAPFEITKNAAEPIMVKLMENQYEIMNVQHENLSPAVFCIIAKPMK